MAVAVHAGNLVDGLQSVSDASSQAALTASLEGVRGLTSETFDASQSFGSLPAVDLSQADFEPAASQQDGQTPVVEPESPTPSVPAIEDGKPSSSRNWWRSGPPVVGASVGVAMEATVLGVALMLLVVLFMVFVYPKIFGSKEKNERPQ